MKSSFLFRSRILLVLVLIFAALNIAKLFFVQIVQRNFYADLTSRQYSTPPANIFERGNIYFMRKDSTLVSAALQTTGFKVTINPTKITDMENAYNLLSEVITISRDDFIAKASKTKDIYEEVAHRLTKEEADAISARKIPGVFVYKEKWRFYPGGNLSSQSLGFVAYKGDKLAGRYGIERQYNKELSRMNGKPYVNFFAEVFSNINKAFFEDGTKEGDVVTTIEPSVQSFLEKELSQVQEKYQVDSIGGIIMNPKDGSIYALGVKPDFDLNDFSQVKTSTFSNPLVENVVEFGSVVKPLVMAGALDAGVLTAETTYNDKGSVIVEKHEIFNFDKKARGPNISMQEVLSQSLNTGMVFVEQKLGREKLRDYLLGFGIKEKTGIDLPNETGGLVSGILTSPREIEYANAAFGQGIALTPMAMIRALAALSNGGNLVVPHVVQKIKYNDGTEKEMTYTTTRAKIFPATAEEITRMLVTIMDTALQGGLAKLERYSVAVKTGTAQVANTEEGGYYTDRHTHSFFGYFPAYDPQFIVLLYAINPKGVSYAAQTWADPFLKITKFLLNYYEVPPDR
ncbi:hypothetical protein A3A01_02065 [Candidatus Nomurabacteria bacterium RIFCSPLOWO2_01_FULL_39_17]|uniref:Penicillin-binding protein transpeptidase domain-containing protein n=1 Tax=Candidatus Nomurabacteria bacterium RIFCSPLOWO2_01_FULL_39_17 TaxID=1801770 RepID=A0A1F6WWS7_9BACT|nr:MAG: hypothetical protein A3A01_02065 [Candidatus Nomurabacteria bacterium RIFCSPLOWO2_01_FULL_39_17]